MGAKTKFVVALGAVVGIAGVFLPLASESPGAGTGRLSQGMDLGRSLWSAANLPGVGIFAYAVLGCLILSLCFSAFGMARRFGRGLAAGAILASLVPTGMALVWLSEVLPRVGPGLGLVLLTVGGVLSGLGAAVALASPER